MKSNLWYGRWIQLSSCHWLHLSILCDRVFVEYCLDYFLLSFCKILFLNSCWVNSASSLFQTPTTSTLTLKSRNIKFFSSDWDKFVIYLGAVIELSTNNYRYKRWMQRFTFMSTSCLLHCKQDVLYKILKTNRTSTIQALYIHCTIY